MAKGRLREPIGDRASSLHTVFGRTFFSIDYQNDRKNDGQTAGMAGLKCENGNVTLIHVFHLVLLQHHAKDVVLIHPASRRHSFNETRHELNSTGAW